MISRYSGNAIENRWLFKAFILEIQHTFQLLRSIKFPYVPRTNFTERIYIFFTYIIKIVKVAHFIKELGPSLSSWCLDLLPIFRSTEMVTWFLLRDRYLNQTLDFFFESLILLDPVLCSQQNRVNQ